MDILLQTIIQAYQNTKERERDVIISFYLFLPFPLIKNKQTKNPTQTKPHTKNTPRNKKQTLQKA